MLMMVYESSDMNLSTQQDQLIVFLRKHLDNQNNQLVNSCVTLTVFENFLNQIMQQNCRISLYELNMCDGFSTFKHTQDMCFSEIHPWQEYRTLTELPVCCGLLIIFEQECNRLKDLEELLISIFERVHILDASISDKHAQALYCISEKKNINMKLINSFPYTDFSQSEDTGETCNNERFQKNGKDCKNNIFDGEVLSLIRCDKSNESEEIEDKGQRERAKKNFRWLLLKQRRHKAEKRHHCSLEELTMENSEKKKSTEEMMQLDNMKEEEPTFQKIVLLCEIVERNNSVTNFEPNPYSRQVHDSAEVGINVGSPVYISGQGCCSDNEYSTGFSKLYQTTATTAPLEQKKILAKVSIHPTDHLNDIQGQEDLHIESKHAFSLSVNPVLSTQSLNSSNDTDVSHTPGRTFNTDDSIEIDSNDYISLTRSPVPNSESPFVINSSSSEEDSFCTCSSVPEFDSNHGFSCSTCKIENKICCQNFEKITKTALAVAQKGANQTIPTDQDVSDEIFFKLGYIEARTNYVYLQLSITVCLLQLHNEHSVNLYTGKISNLSLPNQPSLPLEENETCHYRPRSDSFTILHKTYSNLLGKPNLEINDFFSIDPVKIWGVNGEHYVGQKRYGSKKKCHCSSRIQDYNRIGKDTCYRSIWMTLHSNFRECGCQVNTHSAQIETEKWMSASKFVPVLDNLDQQGCKGHSHHSFVLQDILLENEKDELETLTAFHDGLNEPGRIGKNNKIQLGNTKMSTAFDLNDLVSFLQREKSKPELMNHECYNLKLLLRRLVVQTKVKSAQGKISKKKKERIRKQAKRKTLQSLMEKFFELFEIEFQHKSEDQPLKRLYKQIFEYVPFRHDNTLMVYPIHGLRDYFELMSVPVSERPPHGETMRFEWVRVRSFWSFPSNILVSPVALSRVGFYYTGKVSECKCFCCGAVYKDWKDGDDPYTIHRQISPTCPYLNGNESGNVPIHEEDRVCPRPEVVQTLLASSVAESRGAAALAGNETLPGISSFESSQIPVPQGSNQTGDFTFKLPANQQTATQQPSLPQPGAGFFSRPPQPNLNTVTPLTSSGGQQPTGENVPARNHSDQFSFGVPPRTQAPATTQPTLVLRQPGQQSAEAGQPSFAPQSSQPSLQFNQGSNASRPTSAQSTSGQSQPTTSARSNQTPLTTTAATNLTTTSNVNRSTSTAQSASSTSTHAGPSTEPTTSQAGAISESSRSRFDPLGINFEKPKYPAYAVLTVRINTYNGWPDYLDQSPRDMALAGFFYAGYGDYTRCFFCGGGLRNWEAGDDPWVEHARWFPKCAFLRQNQGEKFVNIVQQKHQEAEAANRPLVLPRQLSVLDRGAGSSDIMSSVCVQTLREMGKDDNVIREAIEKWQNRRRPGIPVNSAELQATEIYEIILQIEEERDTRNRPSLQASRPTSSTSPNNQLVPQSSSMVASGEQGEGATAASDPSEKFEGLDEVFDEWLINKMKLTCKICQDNPVAIAFLPCGHLVCCLDCAPAMRKCPSCHHVVKGTIKTFFP